MNYHPFLNTIRKRLYLGYGLIAGAVLLVSVPAAQSAIQFEDSTDDAGFSYLGRSWGAAWGDYDGDGLADLWVPNHLSPPDLFRNRGDGTFENVTEALVPPEVRLEHDMHGSAWADFDNDGDLDLLQSVGADIESSGRAGAKLLLVNDGGAFTERAADYGLEYLEGRGRMLLWLDADNDGWLDVYNTARSAANSTSTAALFRQGALGFEDMTAAAGVTPDSNRGTNYAMLGDIGGTGGLELLVDDVLKFPVKVLETGDFPLNDILQDLAPAPELNVITQDAAIADLDGDLDNDIYTVTGPRNSNVVLAQPNVLEGHFGAMQNSERGVRFKTTGDVLFDFRWLKKDQWSLTDIRIGSSGYSPSRFIPTLPAQDPVNHGIAPHTPGVSKGVYVGYDPAAEEWVFLVSTPLQTADFVITSDTEITEFTAVGWDPAGLPTPDFYYVNNGAGFSDEAGQRGIDLPSSGRSIVAGDFDNDMDLDLYIVSTGPVQNLPNTLYENQGNGHFVKVANGGGAAGTIDGRGDAVAMADYDADGYLDLFVTNGKSRRPFEEDGPVQLFHNTGSGNHWLQLDLEGVQSNRDGIGARIELTAGGVTQLREQNAGIHARAQNQMRVHFGLAANTQADRIVIHWPSGITQQLDAVAADQVLRVIEPALANNEPPAITPLANQILAEDTVSPPLAFRVGDLGTAPEQLSVTAFSSDPSVIPHSGLAVSGNGADRTLVVTSAADRSGGPVSISLTVSDGAATASTAFDVTVQAVNDAPRANDDDATINGAGTVTINLAENDSDVDNALNLASIRIVSAPTHGELAVNDDGSVNYSTSAAGPLSDGFTYTIDDISGATSNTASVNIQIDTDGGNTGTRPPDDVLRGLGLNPDDPDGDTDDDGISDIDEIGSDASSPLDSDNDGIIDALEPGADATDAGVASGLPAAGGTSVTVITSAGESLSGLRVETAQNAPAGVDLFSGLISYTTTSAVGGSVTVRMTFSRDLPASMVVYKLDDLGRYSELSAATWTRVGARHVDVHLTDGDPLLDQDGAANGVIVDPIAFGSPVSPSAVSSGGGGGGCRLGSAGTGRDPVLPLLVVLSLLGQCLRRPARRP